MRKALTSITPGRIRAWLHNFFDFFLDSLEEFVSLFIAGRIIYLQQTRLVDVDAESILGSILTIVGLLAIGNIRDKSLLKKTNQLLHDFSNDLSRKTIDPIRADNLFNMAHEPSKEFFQNCKEINVSGITLVKTIGKYHEIIADRLQEGTNVKVVMLKTTTDSVLQLGLRSWGPTQKGYYNTRIKATEDQLKVIAENVKTKSTSHGSLAIGYLPFVPSFGITMIDPRKATGVAWIEIYHHKTDDTGPNFYVYALKDAKWFSFFRKQFDEMWKASEKKALLQRRT